jgi:hypothetical protein
VFFGWFCQLSNNPKSLQICSVYLILTSLGQLMSNPNWTALDRRGGRYRPSTSRFQKADMMRFAVNIVIFIEDEFAVIFPTLLISHAAFCVGCISLVRNYRCVLALPFLGILVFMNFHILRISKITKFLLSIFDLFL